MARFQQQGFQLDRDFQLDQNFEAPSSGLPSTSPASANDQTTTEQDPTSGFEPQANSPTDKTPIVAPEVNTKGGSVQEVSTATAQTVAVERNAEQPTHETFFSSYWPYLLALATMLGWVISQLFKKSAPSFKHDTIVKPQASDTGPPLTGQFKVSQRFQKAKSEEKLETDNVPETNESSVPNQKQAAPKANTTFENQRPTDEEFDLEFGGNDSGVDVIDKQEAAKIIADGDSRQTKGPSSRFKNGTQSEKPSAE